MIKKVKMPFHGHMLCDLNSKEIIWMFYEKPLQNTNQNELAVEKVIEKRW